MALLRRIAVREDKRCSVARPDIDVVVLENETTLIGRSLSCQLVTFCSYVLSIMNLFDTTDLPDRRLLVMRDHPEGIIAFGELAETSLRLVELSTAAARQKLT